MAHIDYYFSVLSPFAYLAGDRMERIADKHGASVAYKPVDLMRVFAETGGTPPPKRHPSRQAYRLQELPRIATLNGMKINISPAHWPTNFTPATAAVLAAEAAGADAGAVARAALSACWAEEKNIADIEVVGECLAAGGMEPADLAAHIEDALAQIEPLTDEAIERGVFGAPSYVVGDEIFWGQDRLPHLDAYLGSL